MDNAEHADNRSTGSEVASLNLDAPQDRANSLDRPGGRPYPQEDTYSLSIHASLYDTDLPPLQVPHGDPEGLTPLANEVLDPGSFDIVAPPDQQNDGPDQAVGKDKLEQRSELLFSTRHLQAIFDDPSHLYRFSTFLRKHRPQSVALYDYYINALKALRAIDYSNAILSKLPPLDGHHFTHDAQRPEATVNKALREKASIAFETLAQEDLPMYITQVWIQTVTESIKHRVRANQRHQFEEGLAEVFCLTDPSRRDNPIVLMSGEFNKTTQYGVDYAIGRNCRFLQGPCSNPFSVRRIRERLEAGMEHCETFLNYRRDGSSFMNLLMLAPLYDNRGKIRYFIGAQVDVSGLAMDCYDLDSLKRLVEEEEAGHATPLPSNELAELAEIMSPGEVDVMRDKGGEMHRSPLRSHSRTRSGRAPDSTPANGEGEVLERINRHPTRVILDGESPPPLETSRQLADDCAHMNGGSPPVTGPSFTPSSHGRLAGVYEHYLLVRPYPSLHILFTSRSMRVPGILQSPLIERIGGSQRRRDQLMQAFASGQAVTAKVDWLTVNHKLTHQKKPPMKSKSSHQHQLAAQVAPSGVGSTSSENDPPIPFGRPRWLHCTPLLGSNGKIGVWMIVLIDPESEGESKRRGATQGRSTQAPPVQQQLRVAASSSCPSTATSILMSETESQLVAAVTAQEEKRNGDQTNGMTSPGPARREEPSALQARRKDSAAEPETSNRPRQAPSVSARWVHTPNSSETLRTAKTLPPVPVNGNGIEPRSKRTALQQSWMAMRKPKSTLKDSRTPSQFFNLDALSRGSKSNAVNHERKANHERKDFVPQIRRQESGTAVNGQ